MGSGRHGGWRTGTAGRRWVVAALVAVTALLVTAAALPAGATPLAPNLAIGGTGPAGARFYAPPRPLPAGPHGTLIWHRPYDGAAALAGAANTLLLYTQVGVAGATVATSGVVAVPRGTPPRGGWPVVTWAHGTTGIADQCAPTRQAATGTMSGNTVLLDHWVRHGYAVVATDYEGLGTPGLHPYLIGPSEGRAVLDAVVAARQFDPALSDRVVIAGHSQGGHAALWAASLAPTYTPGLQVAGTIAFAPASQLAGVVRSAPATPGSARSGTVALMLRGLAVADPSVDVTSVLSPRAWRLWPETASRCSTYLNSSPSFGALPLDQLFRPGADLTPIEQGISANDPGHLAIAGPVLIEQGLADTTIPPAFTRTLAGSLAASGNDVVLHTYPRATHASIPVAAESDATAFLRRQLPA